MKPLGSLAFFAVRNAIRNRYRTRMGSLLTSGCGRAAAVPRCNMLDPGGGLQATFARERGGETPATRRMDAVSRSGSPPCRNTRFRGCGGCSTACAPGGPELAMSIGEPKHPLPALVAERRRRARARVRALSAERGRAGAARGHRGLGAAALRRWRSTPRPQVIALNGTREGLFNAALALSPETKGGGRPAVLMPNPFYQAYGAAALAVGAEPVPVPATAATGLPARLRGAAARRCSTGSRSPTSARRRTRRARWRTPTTWRALIALAERHDFRRAGRRVLRRDLPRRAARRARWRRRGAAGADPERVVVFHSLSKRSNAPGLRSGFAAGGPRPIAAHAAAARLWRRAAAAAAAAGGGGALARRGACGREPRALPREVRARRPGARRHAGLCVAARPGFFLWLRVGDGEAAALRLWREAGVRVLPGGYLGRADGGRDNPGDGLYPRRAGRRGGGGRARPDGDPRRRSGRVRRRGSNESWQHAARAKRRAPPDGERHRGGAAPARRRAPRPDPDRDRRRWPSPIVWTYSPDDPSLFSATDEAPRNALGLVGASIADPLHRALGWAAYGIALAFGAWGLRLVLHARRDAARSAGRSRRRWRCSRRPPSPRRTCRWRAGAHDYGLGGPARRRGAAAAAVGDAARRRAWRCRLASLALGLGFAVCARPMRSA